MVGDLRPLTTDLFLGRILLRLGHGRWWGTGVMTRVAAVRMMVIGSSRNRSKRSLLKLRSIYGCCIVPELHFKARCEA